MKNNIICCILPCLLVVANLRAHGQQAVPYLERTITISFVNERMDAALKKIADRGGFTFSYSNAILDVTQTVSLNFVNKTVREILDQLFNGTIQYKARGRYIILSRAETSSRQQQVFSGYIVDEATGERLKDVSVYDPVTLTSTVTDSYGYFEIKVDEPRDDLRLAIYKQNYSDTLIAVPSRDGRLLNIPINTEKITTLADSVGIKIKRFWKTKILLPAHVNIINIRDTLYRKRQLSFVPFIGTNHALSGNVINDYSFNILGGFSGGTRKFELGGVFNIDRGDVRNFQIAGAFNAVGGNVKGGQFAGILNANLGTMQGAQVAGVYNVNWDSVKYFSAAGVFTFNRRSSDAWQLAGVANLTIGRQLHPHFAGVLNFSTRDSKSQIAGAYNFTAGNLQGWQAGGALNFTAKNVRGLQTAGVLNFTGKDMSGAQAAGVLNFTGKSVEGVQIGGVVNFTGKKIKGAQLSGVLNYATKVQGVQVGLFNVADSVKGVPFGLMSFVWKGYHKIEIAADEIFYTNLSFRTGVNQFYNILTAGAKPATFSDEWTFWSFGYGIGTAPKLARKFYLNVDLTSSQIMQGNSIDTINLLNKLYLGIDYQVFKKVSLTLGATLNARIIDTTYNEYQDLFTLYKPDILYTSDFGRQNNISMWLGGKIGVRFL